MQAHVRHVEKFTNFMSPVGLSISHYNNSHPRKRQRFTNLTNPPNITGNISSGSGSNSDTDHPANQKQIKIKPNHRNKANSVKVNTQTVALHHNNHHNNDDISSTVRENRWTRENLSLRHLRNRSMYLDNETVNNELMNNILDKLLIYGYETSADIAKMQPWQLRVLKKEIPQIDFIFMTAYRMWGKQEYYDDTQNLTFRQYWDPAVWLQYNEIELIIKCFDISNRGYQCMICGVKHGLYELDVVRWHIWLEHKDSNQLNAIMQSTKKHNQNNFTKPLQNLQLPPLENEKSVPQVISLIDSTDDEMEIKKKESHKKRYNNKARQYSSKRKNNHSPHTHNNNSRRRRSRRLANKNNTHNSPEIITPKTVQNPIIINGCNADDDDDMICNTNNNNNNNNNTRVMQVHGSLSPAFMPSAHAEFNNNNNNHNNNKNAILNSMNSMKNDSTFSLDTHDSAITMDMDDEYNWNNDSNMNDMNEFNMIGFNDDFSTLGVMGVLSRNSSDSFNELNGAFVDPGKNFSFQPPEKLNLNSNFANPY